MTAGVERRRILDRGLWLDWRKHDITASDLGALAGVDPYKTRLQLYLEKTGVTPPAGETNLMRRGRWLEAATMTALREALPDWRFEKANVYLRNPVLQLGATPDVVAEPAGEKTLVNIQLKAIGRPTFEREWQDGVPLRYELQTLAEGMLMGADANMVAVLVIDTYSADLELFDVKRHAAAEKRIRAMATAFWQDIAEGRRPAADYERDAEVIAQLYPQSVPEPVLDLSGDNRLAELLPVRAACKEEVAAIEAKLKVIDVEIKDKMGEHELATLDGWKLSWKTQHIAEHVRAATTRRPLLVTEIKAEDGE